MKADVQPSPDKPKIPLPTLSQINADRITLVSNQKRGYVFGVYKTLLLYVFFIIIKEL